MNFSKLLSLTLFFVNSLIISSYFIPKCSNEKCKKNVQQNVWEFSVNTQLALGDVFKKFQHFSKRKLKDPLRFRSEVKKFEKYFVQSNYYSKLLLTSSLCYTLKCLIRFPKRTRQREIIERKNFQRWSF